MPKSISRKLITSPQAFYIVATIYAWYQGLIPWFGALIVVVLSTVILMSLLPFANMERLLTGRWEFLKIHLVNLSLTCIGVKLSQNIDGHTILIPMLMIVAIVAHLSMVSFLKYKSHKKYMWYRWCTKHGEKSDWKEFNTAYPFIRDDGTPMSSLEEEYESVKKQD